METTFGPQVSRPFDLHPDFSSVLSSFRVAAWKKLGFNQVGTLKNQGVAAPYKNLGRFYRVSSKSLLRVQIKRATVST